MASRSLPEILPGPWLSTMRYRDADKAHACCSPNQEEKDQYVSGWFTVSSSSSCDGSLQVLILWDDPAWAALVDFCHLILDLHVCIVAAGKSCPSGAYALEM